MKSLNKYLRREECGYKFVAKYVDGVSGTPSDAMDLGNWFEYVATGQLPRDGKVPHPKTLKSGKLAANYQRMEIQAQNFKDLMKHHKF